MPIYIVSFVTCNTECEVNMTLGITHIDKRNKTLTFNIAGMIKVQYGQIRKIYEQTHMCLMSVIW